MKVSVVIPTYNRATYVVHAIESVFAQRLADLEVIVVDDGSNDNTADVVKKLGTAVTYLRQENRGASSARNCGIMACSGEWVAFLDSDDEWVDGYLVQQLDLINRHPVVVASIMNSVEMRAQGMRQDNFGVRDLLPLFGPEHEFVSTDSFSIVIRHHVSILNTCVFRRNTLLSTRLFDETLTIAEDLDVIAQMALKGPFVFSQETGARIYRRKEENANLSAQFFNSGIRTRQSWARVFNRLWNEPLTPKQRQALATKYSGNMRALGNLYVRVGSRTDAVSAYSKAWQLDHSPRSLLRLVSSRLPLRLAKFLLHKEGQVQPC